MPQQKSLRVDSENYIGVCRISRIPGIHSFYKTVFPKAEQFISWLNITDLQVDLPLILELKINGHCIEFPQIFVQVFKQVCLSVFSISILPFITIYSLSIDFLNIRQHYWITVHSVMKVWSFTPSCPHATGQANPRAQDMVTPELLLVSPDGLHRIFCYISHPVLHSVYWYFTNKGWTYCLLAGHGTYNTPSFTGRNMNTKPLHCTRFLSGEFKGEWFYSHPFPVNPLFVPHLPDEVAAELNSSYSYFTNQYLCHRNISLESFALGQDQGDFSTSHLPLPPPGTTRLLIRARLPCAHVRVLQPSPHWETSSLHLPGEERGNMKRHRFLRKRFIVLYFLHYILKSFCRPKGLPFWGMLQSIHYPISFADVDEFLVY